MYIRQVQVNLKFYKIFDKITKITENLQFLFVLILLKNATIVIVNPVLCHIESWAEYIVTPLLLNIPVSNSESDFVIKIYN